jgi:hypothetical protein
MQLQILPLALADLGIARDLLLVRLLVARRLGAWDQPSLCIAEERFTLRLKRRRLVAHEHLIIPRFVTVTAVNADVPCGSFAIPRFALPFDIRGCGFLVVEVSAEGQRETLVQALLVEEVCLFEAREVAGDERRAGDNGGGEDAVCFCRLLSGDGRDVLGCC